MTKINATVVADSIIEQGDRLTSLLITFPRILLSEINTHRMLSKDTSSSRAIPFNKMVESLQNDPFIPIVWQKDHKGMQGTKYIIDPELLQQCEWGWLQARDFAIQQAKSLNNSLEVTKQLCNRLLEPFMWTTMLITGSKEGWRNFFNLRCPQYQLPSDNNIYKSKKSAMKGVGANNLALTNSNPHEKYQWLSYNKGQAEIHMMLLAECIYDAVNESTPKQLNFGDCHIPMV